MAAILVDSLCKNFRVREPSRRGIIATLFRPPPVIDVPAVHDISFAIGKGERVAFIGPNGAGKSTTLKILTGILRPTSGHAEVADLVPWHQRRQLAHRIGIVFGQRSQLWHHLPVRSSLDLLRRIYNIDAATYGKRLTHLSEVFEIAGFLDRPVSELSLGQRIRCEITAVLLHAPSVLLLDEPTIGLDVTAKAALRDHLNTLSREAHTTVLLTSHDTGDIEKICDRVIIIDEGRLLLDEALDRLRRSYLKHRSVVLVTAEERPSLELPGVTVASAEPYRLTLNIDTEVTAVEHVVGTALRLLSVRDLIIENPPLEDIVKAIYRGQGRRGYHHAPL
jgi:ABC-2 type transport system ATP-binding protein